MKLQNVWEVLTDDEKKNCICFLNDKLDGTPKHEYFKEVIEVNIDKSAELIMRKSKDFQIKYDISANRIRTYNHQILQLLYDFIAQFSVQNTLAYRQLLLHDFFINRKQYALADSVYQKIDQVLEQSNFDKTEYLGFKLILLKSKMKDGKLFTGIDGQIKHLSQLKGIISEIHEYEKIVRDYELMLYRLYNPNLDIQSSKKKDETAVEQIYNHLMDMIKEGDFLKNYNAIISILNNNENTPKHIKRDILLNCINYCTAQISRGEVDYYKYNFMVHKEMIEADLQVINEVSYRNISYLACRAEEYDWAMAFVDKNKNQLPDKKKETGYSFSKAIVQWYAKDYMGVIATLRNVEYEDIGYKLQTRAYLLTCYFELDEYDVLDSSIKAFKVFLRRRRNVPKSRKDSYYGFLTILDHLMKAGERNDIKRIQKAKEVLDSGPIAFQDWLREKIAETEAVIKK